MEFSAWVLHTLIAPWICKMHSSPPLLCRCGCGIRLEILFLCNPTSTPPTLPSIEQRTRNIFFRSLLVFYEGFGQMYRNPDYFIKNHQDLGGIYSLFGFMSSVTFISPKSGSPVLNLLAFSMTPSTARMFLLQCDWNQSPYILLRAKSFHSFMCSLNRCSVPGPVWLSHLW